MIFENPILVSIFKHLINNLGIVYYPKITKTNNSNLLCLIITTQIGSFYHTNGNRKALTFWGEKKLFEKHLENLTALSQLAHLKNNNN